MSMRDGTTVETADTVDGLEEVQSSNSGKPAWALKRLDARRRRLWRTIYRSALAVIPVLVLSNMVLTEEVAPVAAIVLDIAVILFLVQRLSMPVLKLANAYHEVVLNTAARRNGLEPELKPNVNLLHVHRESGALPSFDRARIFDGVVGDVAGYPFRAVRVVAQTTMEPSPSGTPWRTEFVGDVLSLSVKIPKDFRMRITRKCLDGQLPPGLRQAVEKMIEDGKDRRVRFGRHSLLDGFEVRSNDPDLARQILSSEFQARLDAVQHRLGGAIALVVANGVATLTVNHGRIKIAHGNALPWRSYSTGARVMDDLAKETGRIRGLQDVAGGLLAVLDKPCVTAM